MKLNIILSLVFQLLFVTTVWTNSIVVVAEDETTQPSTTTPAFVVSPCQEDYSPCTCRSNSTSEGIITIDVTCNNVPSVAAVQAVFRRPTTARQITSFSLTIPYWETNNTIPSHLLNITATRDIYLTCPPMSNGQIKIDTKAFSASADYAQSLTIVGCDLNQLNFTFLKDLYAMSELYYSNVSGLSSVSASLPSLPSLSKLTVMESSDFQGFSQFPVPNVPAWSELSVISCPEFKSLSTVSLLLTKLTIESCPLFKEWDAVIKLNRLSSLSLIGYDEAAVNEALDVIITSTLKDNIVDLNLNQNGLMEVPHQIESFSQLQKFYLMSNNIVNAENGSISLITSKLNMLKLSSNNLNNIESNAFQGEFGASQIYLDNNNLTRFESSVFLPILERMESVNQSGFVDILNNPIECDCHLVWLIRENSKLVHRVLGGKCSNGNDFSSLTAQDFSDCNSDGTVKTTTFAPPTTQSSAVSSILLFDHTIYLVLLLSTFLGFQSRL